MTDQAGEVIRVHGVEHHSIARPLAPLLTLLPNKIHGEFFLPEVMLSTCHRGYMGSWEVLLDRLYLVELSNIALGDAFPGFPNRVFAHWVSGIVPLWWESFDSRFGTNQALEIRKGKVIRILSGSEVMHSDQLLTWEDAEEPRAPENKELWSVIDIDLVRSIERIEDPLNAVPTSPFGHLAELWEIFEAKLVPGSTIWSYEILEKGCRIQSGYASVKKNEVVDFICTEFLGPEFILEDEMDDDD
jgi:hypothetical protein